LDVLSVVNYINQRSSSGTSAGGAPYNYQLDVDRDGSIGPLDVLQQVNAINAGNWTDSSFESLTMSNSSDVSGFTNSLTVRGKLNRTEVPYDGIAISVNGGVKRDASQFIQADGSFEVSDRAIQEMFGGIGEGLQTISVFAKEKDFYTLARDRKVILKKNPPDALGVVVKTPVGDGVYVGWSQAGYGSRYDIYVKKQGSQSFELLRSTWERAEFLSLPFGSHELYVEAIDIANNRVRSSVTVVGR
jgi:hypothetical protein